MREGTDETRADELEPGTVLRYFRHDINPHSTLAFRLLRRTTKSGKPGWMAVYEGEGLPKDERFYDDATLLSFYQPEGPAS